MPAEAITNNEVMILAPNMDTIEVIAHMLNE
jgi:hypothetical protein